MKSTRATSLCVSAAKQGLNYFCSNAGSFIFFHVKTLISPSCRQCFFLYYVISFRLIEEVYTCICTYVHSYTCIHLHKYLYLNIYRKCQVNVVSEKITCQIRYWNTALIVHASLSFPQLAFHTAFVYESIKAQFS